MIRKYIVVNWIYHGSIVILLCTCVHTIIIQNQYKKVEKPAADNICTENHLLLVATCHWKPTNNYPVITPQMLPYYSFCSISIFCALIVLEAM